jgi:hypothetical protein
MILWNISFIDKNGLRTMLGPMQGRFMKQTRAMAEKHLKDIFTYTGENRLVEICGEQARGTFRVDAFDCWNHGDPKSIYVAEDKAA